MKLKSFGCSFFYGSDLHDCEPDEPPYGHSNHTWPALIAKDLGYEYECVARPGQGNFRIYTDIILHNSIPDDSIFLINWTWIDRFDFVDQDDCWMTLMPSSSNESSEFYYRHLHSQLCDMIRSVSYIQSSLALMESTGRKFLMTYMDDLVLSNIDPNWHDPRYLELLQEKIKPYLHSFDGKNFLEWSRDRKFPVSDRWHPLEDAHRAAADYFIDAIRRIA